MSDLSVTAANCVPSSNATTVRGVAGETIAAGKAVYRSASTSKWLLADSNAAAEEARGSGAGVGELGLALTGSSANQPIVVQTAGDVTLGATLTPGVQYYLSDTPGGICPVADIGSGEYMVTFLMAKSATLASLNPKYSGVAL